MEAERDGAERQKISLPRDSVAFKYDLDFFLKDHSGFRLENTLPEARLEAGRPIKAYYNSSGEI